MNKKLIVLFILFFLFIRNLAQKSIAFSASDGKVMTESQFIYNEVDFSENSYLRSLYTVPRFDVHFNFNKDITLKLGYTVFHNPILQEQSGLKLQQNPILDVVPLNFVVSRKLYKGLNICTEFGVNFNRLRNDYKKNSVITYEMATDSNSVFTTVILAKHKITLTPSIGFQLQYRFNNDIEFYWLTSRIFGLGQEIFEIASLLKEPNGEFVKELTFRNHFNQYWSRIGITIPLYHFNNNEE